MAAPLATTAHLQEPSSSQQGFGRQGYGSHQQLASPQAAHAQVVQAVQTGQAGPPAMLQVQLTQAPFVALPGAQLTQAPYWPVDMVAYPSSPTLLERIIHQVHYYFSAENLCRDEFLRGHMDQHEGWLHIQLIASFNRLRSLTMDVNLVAEALRLSPELEVCNGMVRKRHDWQRWLVPQAQLGGPTSPTPSSPDSRSDPTSPLVRTGSTGFSRVTEAPSSDSTANVIYGQTATTQPSRSSPVSPNTASSLQHAQAGGKPTHQQPLLPPSLHQQPQPRQPQPQQQKQKQQQKQLQQQQKQQWPRAMLAAETPSMAAGGEAAGEAPVRGRDAATSKQQSRLEPRSASSRKASAPYAQPSYETRSAGSAQGSKLPSYGASAAAHGLPSNASSRGGLEAAAAAGAATSRQLLVPSAGSSGTASGQSTRPSTAEGNSAGSSAGKRAAAAAPSDLDEAEELALLQEWQLLGNGSSLADWRAAHDLWVEAQLGGALRAAAAREQEEPWETAQSNRRSARKGGPGDRKDSGNESEIGVEIGVSALHLKDAPPLSDRTSKGEVRGSNQSKWDEGHSDQTTLLNDEDWSSLSAGSAEDPRPSSPDAHTDGTPTSGPASSPGREKLGVNGGVKRSPCKTKPADKAGAPPCKPHVLRELRDAPLLESRGSAASMLAAIDLDLIVSVTSAAAAVASRCAGALYERLLTHTPRTRALVLKHGAERHAQMALVLVALLFLLLLPTSRLPPSLGELVAPRWLELPIGLILGLKVNDLGNKLWTMCTPCPTQHGRAG